MVLKIFTLIALFVTVPLWAQDSPVAPTPTHVIVDTMPAVNVTATVDTTGLATDVLQTAGNASLASLDTKTVVMNTGAVVVSTLPSITFAVPQHMICDSGCAAGVPGQQVMALSQPVVLASNQSSIPVAATVTNSFALETTLQAVKTAVELIDNCISGARCLVTEDSAAAILTAVNSIKTNTDPLLASGAGGYIRQDSTATIAKESGGNLATLAAKDFATSAKQDTGNTSVAALVAALVSLSGSPSPQMSALQTLALPMAPGLPKLPCNAVRRTNCQPKGF